MFNFKELLDDEIRETVEEIEKNSRAVKRYNDEITHLTEEEIIISCLTSSFITVGDCKMPLFNSIVALDMFLTEHSYDLKEGTYICTIDGNELYEIIYEDSEGNIYNRLTALKEANF